MYICNAYAASNIMSLVSNMSNVVYDETIKLRRDGCLLVVATEGSERREEESGVEYGKSDTCDSNHPMRVVSVWFQ